MATLTKRKNSSGMATSSSTYNLMKTETRSHDTTVSTDVEHALEWLKTEHPHGVDLVYVDYRDSLDDNKEMLMEVIKDNYSEQLDEAYLDSQHEGVQYVIDEYKKELAQDGIDDIDDDVLDAMKEWLWEHEYKKEHRQPTFLYRD